MFYKKNIILWAGFSLLALVFGCDDKAGDILIVEKTNQENRTPKIIEWGPVFDSAANYSNSMPQLWIIAGDQDGLDDITAVVLKVSSIKIISLIVRPDDSTQECSRPFYASMDTINILPYLKKKTLSIPSQALYRESNGVYTAYLSYNLLTEGGIRNQSDSFSDFVKLCRWGYDYLYMTEHFGLNRPAPLNPRDVYVTYAKFFISGISITVYDQSGSSATVNYPNFYGTFTNATEEQTQP